MDLWLFWDIDGNFQYFGGIYTFLCMDCYKTPEREESVKKDFVC